MKTVYMCFATDVIHEGHMNVVKKAKEYGKVVAGVLCDAEMVRYNRFPTVSFEERMAMVRNIPEIDEVIVQDRIMYDNVIKELKPDYVIHGDNWCDGPEKTIRENVIALLKEYGGELIEVPYTYNEKVKKIDDQFKEKLAMPEYRRKRLRQLIKTVPIVKTIEVHSGLTGLIAEKTVVEHDGGLDQFDAMWISSLCDSTAKGKPDIELVDMSSRLRTIDDVLDVTTKPIILDGDTGGLIEHFVYNVRTLERMGVSAVIIEDKTGLKKNSLFGTEVEQTQDSIENFCAKIRAGKNVLRTEEFMIIARIESLILERGMEDALTRAFAYVEAGADGITMINTMIGMRFDLKTGKPIIANKTGGYSGPAIFPVALRMVYQVSQAVSIPIIGMGGISSGKDAIEMMIAGANAVAVGCQNLVDPYACPKIIQEMNEILDEMGIKDINEIVGKSHQY